MATPTEQVQTTSNIPEWMKPYAMQLLGQAQALSQQGYQPYMVPQTDAQGNIVRDKSGQPVMVPGQRVAGFNPLQQQAFRDIAGMQTAGQLNQATGLAGLAGLDAGRLSQYSPYASSQNFYTDPAFREMGLGYRDVVSRDIEAAQMGAPAAMEAGRMEAGRMAAPSQIQAARMQAGRMDPVALAAAQTYTAPTVGPYERVGTEKFGLGAMREYMSPYMQGVVERQKDAAVREYARQLPGLKAAGVRAGAAGGTREAILESEARRNLATQLGDIEASGLQQAYQQASSQFGQDRAAMLQAALANQQAGLNTEQQRVAAALQAQGLTAQQAMEVARLNQSGQLTVGQANLAAQMQAEAANQQAAMQAAAANQQAGMEVEKGNLAALMQAEAANLQAKMTAGAANQQAAMQAAAANLQAQMQARSANQQYGLQAQQMNQSAQLQAQQQALAQLAQANQFSQQNAQQRAQYGLAGANLAEQSRQFGAGLGMQGLQQQLAAAGMLGNLGQQQYQQQMGISSAQLGAGGQMQALNQEMLNQRYQDFLNQQRLPYQQAEFMSGILRGLPATGQTSTMYQAPGSMFGQIAGVGLGLGSLFGGLGQTTGR
jgi:hypothetical protein